jgi:hypothetical protein
MMPVTKKCAVYPRQFRLIMPIAAQDIIRDVERKMSAHFGGVTEISPARGWWVDPNKKLIEDDNIMLFSVRSEAEHPYIQHRKDEEFMHALAEEIGEKTNQESVLQIEDMVSRCNFVPIKHGELEKVV